MDKINVLNVQHGNFSVDLVALLIFCVVVIPYLFYKIRDKLPRPVTTKLTLSDYYILSILLVYLVIGVYQQYFWTKDNKLMKETIIPRTSLDTFFHEVIAVDDNWTYIYNFIYYLVFGFIIVSIRDYKHFGILVLGGIALMTGLTIIWYFFPNVIETRMNPKNYFLKKTQAIDDNRNNACPSAHVVFAMYSFYLLRNVIGPIPASIFPILISISCLTTTQHVAIDIISGLVYCVLFYNFILKRWNPEVFQ